MKCVTLIFVPLITALHDEWLLRSLLK